MIDLFYGFFNTGIGIIAILIGLKIYRPFKDKNDSKKEELYLSKYGNFFLIGGALMTIYGIFNIIFN